MAPLALWPLAPAVGGGMDVDAKLVYICVALELASDVAPASELVVVAPLATLAVGAGGTD